MRSDGDPDLVERAESEFGEAVHCAVPLPYNVPCRAV